MRRATARILIALSCAALAASAGTSAWAEGTQPPETVPAPAEVVPIDPMPTPDPAPSPEPVANAEPEPPLAPASPAPSSQGTAAAEQGNGKRGSDGKRGAGSKPAKPSKGKPRPAQKPRPAATAGPSGDRLCPGRDGARPAYPVAGCVAGRAVSLVALGPINPSGAPSPLLTGTLLAAVALAIVLFGLAAAPPWIVPGTRVLALVAERRAELAVAGTLALVTASAVLVLIAFAL